MICQNVISFNSYESFFKVLENINRYEYTLSWIKSIEENRIEGLLYLGNHEKGNKNKEILHNTRDKIKSVNFFIIKNIYTKLFILLKILNSFFCF